MMPSHSEHHERLVRRDSHSLSRHALARPGMAGRVGVHVDPRFTVRFDPDPRTDPLIPLTAQVTAALTSSTPLQTDPPVWGLPPGAAHA
ncbi:hypothetical protein GA0070620_4201 [Micromonospora krabiensis]|uniref:Uncharacterized protein n=1 Tax=Micromonospora krabiensis TaxID=307121 RepID=A0A1C3N7T7_9ACTN|nr:hypothetical protein GA0070620_4201 [Micromonospora krabiensis]